MRVWNFSAGPAVLSEDVLQQAAAEMLDWRGSGMSVMEMSHRGREFIGIAAQAEANLRTLLAIPGNYKVLFLQGGAIGENAIVPMNLVGTAKSADYVNTGSWSKKSIQEAKKYCKVNVAASAEDKGFTYVPEQAGWKLAADGVPHRAGDVPQAAGAIERRPARLTQGLGQAWPLDVLHREVVLSL